MKLNKCWAIGAGAFLALGLVLGACSSDGDGSGGAGTSSDADSTVTTGAGDAIPADADFNQADVDFAQGMIPHHAQAIEMADMAIGRAESPEVRDLAERIRAAQDPEIEQLEIWLEDWGQEVPDRHSSMGGDMGEMGDMSMDGMMSQEQMDAMAAAAGAEFDAMFLEMMVVHHEGALTMAVDEVDNGKFEPTIDMARSIIDGQSVEIEEMRQLQG